MSTATAAAAIKRVKLGAGLLRGQGILSMAIPGPTLLRAAPKPAPKVSPADEFSILQTLISGFVFC